MLPIHPMAPSVAPTFRGLTPTEHAGLLRALHENAFGGKALLMDRKDTTFTGVGEMTDADAVQAVKSIPTHY